MYKRTINRTTFLLSSIIILSIILHMTFIIYATAASNPDDIVGTWERFGDAAEGTTVTVEKIGTFYRAKLDKVTGTLIDLGFEVDDMKWIDVEWASDTTYKAKEMYRYETGDYEYRNSTITINSDGILNISVANDVDDESVIIGTYQTWRKISGNSTPTPEPTPEPAQTTITTSESSSTLAPQVEDISAPAEEEKETNVFLIIGVLGGCLIVVVVVVSILVKRTT